MKKNKKLILAKKKLRILTPADTRRVHGGDENTQGCGSMRCEPLDQRI